jgi:hypothetical protein
MKLALALVLVACSGCSLTPTMPTRIEIPVAVSCVKELPAKPALRTAAELSAMDEFKLPIALYEDRLARMQYQALLEAALEACRKP